MKKAVIAVGGKQYLVSEGESLDVELQAAEKSLTFTPLLVIDGDKTQVGTPAIDGATVTAEVTAADIKGDKTLAIRYKAKKRVHKIQGHRQHFTSLKISKITSK